MPTVSKGMHRAPVVQKSLLDGHVEKRLRAGALLNAALSRGGIRRGTRCEKCGGSFIIEGHHPDYDEPLEVIWLCKFCHSKITKADTRGWRSLRHTPPRSIRRQRCAADILELRSQLGLTQDDLARVLAVAGSTIARWESGKHTPHRSIRRQLVKLARKAARQVKP